MPSRTTKKPSVVRSPVQNSASIGSMSLVSSPADSASVRATIIDGTLQTSAASRAAISVRTNCDVGTSTLPPRWPHFFSDESWSSKWTAEAPASMYDFINSNALSGPPKPASASATIGAYQRVVDPLRERGARVGRIQALIRIGVPREVRVGRDLPAGEVDGLQAGL